MPLSSHTVARTSTARGSKSVVSTPHAQTVDTVGLPLAFGENSAMRVIFERLPHVLYCEKNGEGAYVFANQAFAQRCGRRRVGEILGRRASDLFPADLAISYEAQDRAVLSTGFAVINHLEVISRSNGNLGWFLTTKVKLDPTDGGAGEALLIVVSVDLNAPVDEHSSLDNLSGLLTSVRAAPGRAWRVAQLAEMVGIGERQLERRMQRLLGIGAKSFIQTVRIGHAAQLLASSKLTLAEVADACGFYDQSQLTRQFRTAKGMTPGTYRQLSKEQRVDGFSSTTHPLRED